MISAGETTPQGTTLSLEDMLALNNYSLSEVQFMAKLAVPGVQGSASRDQVIQYLASFKDLNPGGKVDLLLKKIRGVTNELRAKISMAMERPAVQSPLTEVAVGLGLPVGAAAVAAGAEFARRADLLGNGAAQEFSGELNARAIVNAINIDLVNLIKAKHLNMDEKYSPSGDEVTISFSSVRTNAHLFTVIITQEMRMSRMTAQKDMAVVKVSVSEMNKDHLAEFSIANATDFAGGVKDAMSDGKMDLLEAGVLAVEGAIRIGLVGREGNLSNRVFDTISKVLVAGENQYKEDRRILADALYKDRQDKIDDAFCAYCKVEKMDGRGSCHACGGAYGATS